MCALRPEDKTLWGTAAALRTTLQRYRRPEFLEEWVAVANHLMLAAANNREAVFFPVPPGSMSVNSHASLDWTSAHFGCPGRTRFYTPGTSDRYVRVFRANPGPQSDGGDAGGALDVCFAITRHLQPRVAAILADELGSPDFPDNLNLGV